LLGLAIGGGDDDGFLIVLLDGDAGGSEAVVGQFEGDNDGDSGEDREGDDINGLAEEMLVGDVLASAVLELAPFVEVSVRVCINVSLEL
jgi:hypothetical protein